MDDKSTKKMVCSRLSFTWILIMTKYYHLVTEKDCNTAIKKYRCHDYTDNVKNYWWIVIKIENWFYYDAWYYIIFVKEHPKRELLKINNLSYDL